jgi:hypothetical protein
MLSTLPPRYFGALGNEAQLNTAFFRPLQDAWAAEHGLDPADQQRVILAQVREYQPDVVFLPDLYAIDREMRARMRECAGRRVALVGWRSAPTPDFGVFTDLDLILTAAPDFVPRLRQAGARPAYLPLSFERAMVDLGLPYGQRDIAFSFCGTVSRPNAAHGRRHGAIEQLLERTPLQVWGLMEEKRLMAPRLVYKAVYQANTLLRAMRMPERVRRALPVVRYGVSWTDDPTLPSIRERLPERFQPPVIGVGYFQVLGRSQLTFNYHIDVAERIAGNLRLYEATGMGACLVTDWKENLPDLFEPDREVVCYRSIAECVDKVTYLLNHPEESERIAAAGQRRTLRDHTTEQRVAQADHVFQELLMTEDVKE